MIFHRNGFLISTLIISRAEMRGRFTKFFTITRWISSPWLLWPGGSILSIMILRLHVRERGSNILRWEDFSGNMASVRKPFLVLKLRSNGVMMIFLGM